MNEIHLRLDPPAAGAWNMAVDELWLRRAAEADVATLRFYAWSPATLSLGYFQAAAERDEHAASRDLALVRRSSGGGAIVHDRELTYSLSLPTSHVLAADAETLYRFMHASLVETLAEFGIAARMFERTLTPLGREPFLCFQRRSTGDLVVGEQKVCGSAQRRRKGALLQHGSLLVAASPHAPELPGLVELGGRGTSPSALLEKWSACLRRRLDERGVTVVDAPPSTETLAKNEVEALMADQYGSAAWTNRR